MRTVVQLIVGLCIGRLATVAVLIAIGLLLVPAQPTHGPVPAQRAHETARHEAILNQEYEQEQRQREYGQPGPPEPGADWQP